MWRVYPYYSAGMVVSLRGLLFLVLSGVNVYRVLLAG